MTPLRAIFRRELLATFATPVAYVTLALVAAILAAIFVLVTLRTGEPATLRVVFLAGGWALLAAAPAISMRSFSEEFRQGTWETLFSAPIRPWHAVLGKFLAGMVLLAVLLGVPTFTLGGVLELYGDPDWGEILAGYGGLLLAGGAFLSLGILASTLTANQLVAFLVPVFVLFALSLGSRAIGSALPTAWSSAAFGADPLRRLEDFVLGLVDTSNVVYFAAVTVTLLALACATIARVREGGFGGRGRSALARGAARAETLLFALGAVACAAAATALAGTPPLRGELDATKTRAYSLSPSTVELATSLTGDWSVALLVSGDHADPASLRRVDEVLARLREANPAIVTERIDPDDVSSAARYEALLDRLSAADAAAVAKWSPAIDRAFGTYDALRNFAREESAALQPVLQSLAADAALRPQLEQLAGGLLQLTDQGDAFIAAVRDLLRTTATQPLPDWEGARSALVANDRLWSDQFGTVATLARNWSTATSTPDALRAWAKARGERFERQAAALREEQLALEDLPELTCADVGRVVGQGECAVVMSPRGAIAIPSWQIVPAASANAGRTLLGYDFAARAEELFAGAMRSLRIERLPMVCFVHCEPKSLLERADDRNELVGVADALRTARFTVREWNVVGGDRPTPAKGQSVVYVIVPPLKREGLQLAERERTLIERTRALLRAGEPTLVTFVRSLLPVFGQKDPWDAVAADLGVKVDTGRVILELVPTAADKTETRPWQEIDQVDSSHPIGAAVAGQPIMFSHATPIDVSAADAAPRDRVGSRRVVASVAPSANRWLEDDWRTGAERVKTVPGAKRFTSDAAVVVAIERDDPVAKRLARAVVVGSGGWMLSSLADVAQSLGGSRVVLANPGNRALLLASVAWLAGLDASGFGGSGREVARVATVSEAARATWFVALVLGLPFAVSSVGVAVWARRRRDA
ncbi:MAG: ABC transporter permease subunit [Phycisphaerales bacterium]